MAAMTWYVEMFHSLPCFVWSHLFLFYVYASASTISCDRDGVASQAYVLWLANRCLIVACDNEAYPPPFPPFYPCPSSLPSSVPLSLFPAPVQPSSDSSDSEGFGGTGLSPKEAIITILGVNPLTLLLALAAIGMLSANALLGPGWLRPSLGLKSTSFQSRNLVLPLDQPGFLFPKEASLWGED